jgi:hypothetical protein
MADVGTCNVEATFLWCGPGSSVGVATGYESRWGRDFHPCPDRPWGPTSLLSTGYRVFSWVESGRDVTLTPHPLLVPRSKIRVELYLYSP